MSPRAYDISLTVGSLCVLAGTWLIHGLGPALLVFGLQVTVLTVVGALIDRR